MSNNVNALVMHPDPESVETGADARALYRGAELPPFTQTTSMAPGFMQGSPVIIPGDLAMDFAAFCQRNPKPCPQVASSNPGDPSLPTFGAEIDVRTDIGGYRIWRHGELVDEVTDIRDLWRDDFVTFVIGCSYSFEDALLADGLELRHVTQGVCVPMYMSNIPLVPSGPFSGHMGVSMRPFRAVDAIRAVELTSRFPMTHGTPVHIGDPGLIGIVDINDPLVGDPVDVRDDELPVFWGCGITPQYSLLQARPEIAITHKPGCLLIGHVPSRGDAMAMPTLAALRLERRHGPEALSETTTRGGMSMIDLSTRRARIALLVPSSNTVMENDFHKGLPADKYTVHTDRMYLVETTKEAEIRMIEEFSKPAAKDLGTLNPDLFVFGCTSAGSLFGLEYDAKVCSELGALAGSPAMGVINAVSDALDAVGSKRLAVITPYNKELTKSVADALAVEGREIVAAHGMGITDNVELATPTPAEIVAFAMAHLGGKTFDTLFVSCTNFRALEAKPLLDEAFGVRVITSNSAVIGAIRQRFEGVVPEWSNANAGETPRPERIAQPA